MQRLTPAEFETRRGSFDAAVARTPEIERFSSSSAWLLPARRHLVDESLLAPEETFLWHDAGENHWLAFCRSPHGYWQPYESAWMFACPVIGSDPATSVDFLQRVAATQADADAFVIGGIPAGSAIQAALRGARPDRYREYPATDCLAIDLSRGYEGWLARRSRKFRRSILAGEKRCSQAGLVIENLDGSQAPGLWDRLQAIQVRTGKWASGSDIFRDPRYARFYRELFEDLQARGALRLLMATLEGIDCAFIFGGAFQDEYRGLQMSYAQESGAWGAGNWLQCENLRLRAAEGVTRYDLGMEAEYKVRWADERRELRFAYIAF